MDNSHEGENSHHMHHKKYVAQAAILVLVVLALFLLTQTLNTVKEYRYIGAGIEATNTISVSGEGEVFAIPDIATFSLSVSEEAKKVEDAQREATRKANDIIKYLKDSGVAEKDIKTTNYNVSPRYEYRETSSSGSIRPGNKRVLVGFVVTQSLSVKVRDIDKAGEILSGVGSLGVTNVSGLSFTIDDEDDLKDEAREMAIDDAKEKAKVLAKDLNVSLIRIVGFSEGGGGYPQPLYARAESLSFDGAIGGAVPDLPVGENKITSNVTITYEIR